MINKKTIGKVIQTKRKQKKLTQDEVSEKIGLSPNYFSKVERGLCAINAEAFLKLIEVLDCSLEDFGINSPNHKDVEKQALINRIIVLPPKEVTAYTKMLDMVDEVTKILK